MALIDILEKISKETEKEIEKIEKDFEERQRKLAKDSEERQKEIQEGNMRLGIIQEAVIEKCRDLLEAQMKEVYDARLAQLERDVEESDDRRDIALFTLGMLQLITDREKGKEYVDRAIQEGLLERTVTTDFGFSRKKYRNPLEKYCQALIYGNYNP